MGPHEPFKFEWAGKPYEIPAEDQTKVIAAIEECVTAYELANFVAKHGTAPTAKLAMAFGVLLRHVGIKITDNETRHQLFGKEATPEKTTNVMLALLGLMGALDDMAGDQKPNPTQDGLEDASSSKNSTKRRLAKAG